MSIEEAGTSRFEEASRLHLLNRFDEAEAIYEDLLCQNHDNAGLLATLGSLYLQTGKLGLSISLLERAASKTPQADILCNLGIAYKQTGQYEKCKEKMARALKYDPSAEIVANYAALFINIAEPETALKYANKALAMEPDHAMAHWNKSMALLEMGKWGRGWDESEYGFKCKMRVRRDLGVPYWDGTNGKTIAVYGEQGLGDEIMFSSMLPDLMKENKVIFECHERLKTLFEKSFPGLTIYGNRESRDVSWTRNHELDYAVSIGSLGKWFRRDVKDFPGTPFLKAETLETPKKFRVGISWTGGLKPGRIAVRTIPLPLWMTVLRNDCEFVSLQYTDCHDEIHAVNRLGYNVIERDDLVKAKDYYETAKLVKSCDLVISCATSVYHLAGALGVQTWLLAPNKPAWREGVKGTIPWYRSVRVYRQPPGDRETWRAVMARVGYDLEQLMLGGRAA